MNPNKIQTQSIVKLRKQSSGFTETSQKGHGIQMMLG